MPRKPATIIQNVAPGPPMEIAIATPAMLPRPTVADSAVVSAWNELTSPLSSAVWYLPRNTRKPWRIMRRLTKLKRSVR